MFFDSKQRPDGLTTALLLSLAYNLIGDISKERTALKKNLHIVSNIPRGRCSVWCRKGREEINLKLNCNNYRILRHWWNFCGPSPTAPHHTSNSRRMALSLM